MYNIRTILLSFVFCLTIPVLTLASNDEPIVERGRSLFAAGRWSDARHEFLRARMALADDGGYARQQVDYYLAVCAVELRTREAEAALIDFTKRYPSSVFNNDIRFSLGALYCTGGEFEKAEKAFAAVNYDALDRRGKEQYDIRTGYISFLNDDYDSARYKFERIPYNSEYYDHARYYRAYIDYAQGFYDKAKKGFEALTKSDTYGSLAPYYLLQIEFKQGNYRYVVDRGDALIVKATHRQRGEIQRVMAESWFNLDDYGRALSYLDAFAGSGGEMGRDENYLKGFSLYRSARYVEAVPYLRAACGADDAMTQNASYHLADCYLRGGDKQMAMQSFAMASDNIFDSEVAEDALFNYGKLQYELGGGVFNEAINVLTRYINKYPSSDRTSQARALLIAAYYNSDNYDAAYEAIKDYPSPDADMKGALQKITYFRGVKALTAGDTDGAERYLKESASVNVSPKYSSLASLWLGELAFDAKDYSSARRLYEDYIRRAPKNSREYAMAQYNTGYCWFAEKDMAKAGEAFTTFLSLYDKSDAYRADALNRKGDVLYSERRFSDAMHYYEQAATTSPEGRYYADYRRAVTLGIIDHIPQKIELLRQIVRDGDGEYTDDAAYELGRTYIGQERYKDGATALESFMTKYPSSPYYAAALSDLGLAWLNLGDRAKALKYYDMVISTSPQSSEARDALQGIREIYVSEGDVNSYFAYAEKAGVEADMSALSRDSLSFVSAQKLYLSGRTGDASKSLRSYIKSYPKGYYMADALYYLSDCYLKDGDRENAIEALTDLSMMERTQYAESALSRLSQMTFADKRYEEAASAYRKLYDAARSSSAKAGAATGYVKATLALEDKERTMAMAEDIATMPDAGSVAHRAAQFAQAGILSSSGDEGGAMKIYSVLGRDPKDAEGAASAYYLIEAEYKAGNYDKAETQIYALSDTKTPEAYWLGKAFILLGDIYIARGDAFQARATYQSVADGYTPTDDGLVDEAKERIQKLN